MGQVMNECFRVSWAPVKRFFLEKSLVTDPAFQQSVKNRIVIFFEHHQC